MTWDAKLARRLALRDGTRLITLRDGAVILTTRFAGVTQSAPLAYAIELMMTAERTGTRADVVAATDQLERVLIQAQMM